MKLLSELKKKGAGGEVLDCCVAGRYLVVVQSVHQRDEPPGLRLLVDGEQRNVSDKEGVKQPGHLQVVAGT